MQRSKSMRTRRTDAGVATIVAGLLLAAACSTSAGPPQPSQLGAPPGSAPAQPVTLGFVPGEAENADGEPPQFSAQSACGSGTATYLTELAHVSPDQATVGKEWGDVVPSGKQIMVSGTVSSTHLGPQDVPMSHSFGDDLSMNVKLDPQFTKFSRQLGLDRDDGPATPGSSTPGSSTPGSVAPEGPASPGTGAPRPTTAAKIDEHDNGNAGEDKPGFIHVEISAGLIPHVERPANADGQSWRDLSDFNLTEFQPGLKKPAVGDPVAIMGRWIVDCGHPNYGTELHAITFLAWAHRDADRTTVHFYQNPFRDSEVFSPDAGQLGQTGNASRFTDPSNKPFPQYFVDEIVRLLQGRTERLQARELIDATVASPVDWSVCAPGGRVRVDYDVVARSGTSVRVSEPDASNCLTLHTALDPSYTPAEAKLHMCALPWAFLDEIVNGAVAGGDLDVRTLIKDRVPEQYWPLIDREPVTSCGDALAGPAITPTPTGQNIRTAPDQPFPFYGTITLTPQP